MRFNCACAGPLALALALALLAGAQASSRVALYMSESDGVLDLKWNNGPSNLQKQLVQAGFDLKVTADGQPRLTGVDAYVIPAQNGHTFYSAAEDMSAVASFVENGGLVVMLGGNVEADREFVAKALGYQGKPWLHLGQWL